MAWKAMPVAARWGLLFFLAWGAPEGLAAQVPPVPKKVLILHADNQFQPANLVMDQEFHSRLTGDPRFRTALYSEYLEAVRFPSARTQELRVVLLKDKYAGLGLDLLVVTDDSSWDFYAAQGQTLFPRVPVVFCGITRGKFDPGSLGPEVTGNFKAVDIPANLRVIRRVQPRVTDVEVILGVSPQDRYYEDLARKAFSGFPELRATYLQGYSLEETGRILSTLEPTSVVLYVSLYEDGTGKTYNPRDALDLLAPQSRVPVYGVSETYLGHGILGGNLLSFRDLGKNGADLALEVLGGRLPGAIAAQVVQNRNYFDWKEMVRWGLRDGDLPPESVVQGEPLPPWVVYRDQAAAVLLFVLVESGLVVGLFFQLSSRKRAQKALAAGVAERERLAGLLREEKEQLRVTLRSIGDGVITTDTEGRVLMMNSEAETLTGWTEQEARGQPLAGVFTTLTEGSRNPQEDPARKILATGAAQPLENHTVLVSRDGTERPITDSGAPILDDRGTIRGVVLVFRDMTEKHRLLESLHRADKLNSLGVLAGGIAHDFNNLVGGIVGYIQLIRLQMDRWPGADPQAIGTYLTKATQVVTRTRDLTHQLLTFSKGGEPDRKPADLGEVIRTCGTFFLSGSNVSCRFQIPGDLWACEIDGNQISQVMDNLLLNAKQAMPGGGTITVRAWNLTRDSRDWVGVEVADTGTGIPPDQLPRVFDPFFTTKREGNGLGLATCHSILKKHEGWIEAESQEGRGTTFRFFLPATRAPVPRGPDLPSADHRGSGTILVMDDEPFLKEILGTMLRHMGYQVLEARDGAEALELLEQAEADGKFPRAGIFDLTVPGAMGGKDLAALVRDRWPGLLLLAASGYSDDPVVANPEEYGFAGSLKKPLLYQDLARAFDRFLPWKS